MTNDRVEEGGEGEGEDLGSEEEEGATTRKGGRVRLMEVDDGVDVVIVVIILW